jgi:hypothetical protein
VHSRVTFEPIINFYYSLKMEYIGVLGFWGFGVLEQVHIMDTHQILELEALEDQVVVVQLIPMVVKDM